MNKAPFFSDLADGPDSGAAYWIRAEDDVSLRVGVWPGGTDGTVFLFPGRSEYAEKYGRTADDLARRGWSCLAIDWRGQGLADRLHDDPNIGHVARFTDYQKDVRAMIELARKLDLPQPWHILSHSMGGCIALRTLAETRDFQTAAFSAPMFGIVIAPAMRALSRAVPRLASIVGLGGYYAPTTTGECYLLVAPFEDNMLTTDRQMWDYMVKQVHDQPRFRLGGPSLTWLAEALAETGALLRAPKPPLPVHLSVGTREKIVSIAVIEQVAADWPTASLTVIDGAEHELLMEAPPVRTGFLDRADALFRGV